MSSFDSILIRKLLSRVAILEAGGGGGGVTDHGALTGRADDDHTQYLNDTRLALKTENDLAGVPLTTNLGYTSGQLTTVTKGAVTKTISYNIDNTIDTIVSGGKTKTFVYSSGVLTDIIVT